MSKQQNITSFLGTIEGKKLCLICLKEKPISQMKAFYKLAYAEAFVCKDCDTKARKVIMESINKEEQL